MTSDPYAFLSRRSPVLTTGAMVATSQPLATLDEVETLLKGGGSRIQR